MNACQRRMPSPIQSSKRSRAFDYHLGLETSISGSSVLPLGYICPFETIRRCSIPPLVLDIRMQDGSKDLSTRQTFPSDLREHRLTRRWHWF